MLNTNFQSSLTDLNIGEKKPRIVEYMISKAIDHKPAQCEMTSVLLSDLYGRVLQHEHIIEGFNDILDKLSDLVIDAPHAPEVGLRILFKKSVTFGSIIL